MRAPSETLPLPRRPECAAAAKRLPFRLVPTPARAGSIRRWGTALLVLAGLARCLAGPPAKALGHSTDGTEAGWALADRVAAVVGETPITLRQVLVSASLTRGRTVGSEELDLLREAAVRLVEQNIILQEMADSPEEVAAGIPLEAFRDALTRQAGGEASLKYLRARLGISDGEWNAFIRRAAALDEFVRTRFRPFVYVSQDDIQSYFEKVILNGKAHPDKSELDPYRERIRQILEEIRINEEFSRWLETRKTELGVKILF